MLGKLFPNKGPHKITIQPTGKVYTIGAGKTVLESLLEQGARVPYDCTVGSCTKCKCRLLSGKIRERLDSAYVLEEKDIEDGYILACQSELRSDAEITYRKNNK